MRPNGGWSSSGTQNMQSATGQYSTHAGDPAHPVQHSVMTASSLGFFLRGVVSPVDLGSNFNSSGTIPAALFPVVSAGILFGDYTANRTNFRQPLRRNRGPRVLPPSHRTCETPQFRPVPFIYRDR